MAPTLKDYLTMGRKERIDLALSLDFHRSNAGAQMFKFLLDAKKHGDITKQKLNDQLAIGNFDLNKDTQPFLRKFLNRKLIGEKWIANHIASLTFIMLWDILSETQPIIKDLYSLKTEELPNGFRIDQRETRRILNEYYSYLHNHPVKWGPEMERLADNPNNFVFSFRGPRLTRPLPSKKRSLKAFGTSLTTGKALNPEIHVEDFADPYYLERLFSYRKLVLRMIESIKQRTRIRKEFCWVIDELVHNDYALTVLFQNAAREVENRWFEDLGHDSKFEVTFLCREAFTESEIARSVSIYKKLYDESNKKEFFAFRLSNKKVASNALEQVTLAALYHANRGSNGIPYWLFSNFLSEDFHLEKKDKAIVEHDLGLFEMLDHKYAAAVSHFESASKFWFSERIPFPQEVDSWNLVLARESAGQDASPKRQARILFDNLEEWQVPIELRLFLILQFADIADLFWNKSNSILWLEKGVKCSASFNDFSEIALYFEARLGSLGILGSTGEERRNTLDKVRVMIEKYCTVLGDAENFIVVADRKFHLLKIDSLNSIKQHLTE